MASNDLLAVILVTDPSELNAATARVLASKGQGDINVVVDVEKEVKRAPQSAISFDATALATVAAADLGRVKSGYLQASRIRDLGAAAAAVEQNFNQIRVGVHDDAQVVFGYSRGGAVEGEPRIAQVFTSTLAAGDYGKGVAIAGPAEALCRQLLRAAYLGTLLAAVDLGKERVLLTMIGGGVFGNPHELIIDSIVWAVDQVTALGGGPLTVVLNGRNLSQSVDRAWLRDQCAHRGGVHLSLPCF